MLIYDKKVIGIYRFIYNDNYYIITYDKNDENNLNIQ